MTFLKATIDPNGLHQLKEAIAFGALNAGYALEASAKAKTPVHGGFRSFDPGASPTGGTLRRSVHTAVYVDGQIFPGSPQTDENGESLPHYEGVMGIVVYVGTNIFYAIYVHNGTWKMVARPFIMEAMMEIKAELPALVVAGALKHLGGAHK